MRALIFIALVAFAGGAFAEDYYYQLSGYFPGTSLNDVHFASPDEACEAAYDYDKNVYVPSSGDEYTMDPYQAPYVILNYPPKYLTYMCLQGYRDIKNHPDNQLTISATIARGGDNCKSDEIYNSISGYCEKSSDEQPRKGLGDPSDTVLAGVVCRADPVNVGNGNVFESETDYADAGGELVFTRIYNSLRAAWLPNYRSQLANDNKSLLIYLPDGREVLFTQKNGVATPEPGEFGSLAKVDGLWTYSAPTNDQFTYDASGRLVKWRRPDGLTQSLTYVTGSDQSTTATVKDSQGRTLQFTSDLYGRLIRLVAGGMTITYNFDASSRLTGLSRVVGGKTTTRTYSYGDAAHPSNLTGVTDERGITSATWAYDDTGRAISNQMAGGANKTTFSYGADGSTTVTNALGQVTVYHYAVVQGVKRVTSIEGQPVAGCPASNSSFTYTPEGLLATRTDALGNVSVFTYDAQGRAIKVVEAKGSPDERTTSMTWYGSTHLPLTVTTADRVTTYTYDTQGRFISKNIHPVKE